MSLGSLGTFLLQVSLADFFRLFFRQPFYFLAEPSRALLFPTVKHREQSMIFGMTLIWTLVSYYPWTFVIKIVFEHYNDVHFEGTAYINSVVVKVLYIFVLVIALDSDNSTTSLFLLQNSARLRQFGCKYFSGAEASTHIPDL